MKYLKDSTKYATPPLNIPDTDSSELLHDDILGTIAVIVTEDVEYVISRESSTILRIARLPYFHNDSTYYRVERLPSGHLTCTCPSPNRNGRSCKHIRWARQLWEVI